MRSAFGALSFLIAGALLYAVLPGAAQERDTDGDGMPDALEERLGTDPAAPERLVLLYDDKAQGAGDHDISSKRRLAPDITKVYTCNVAGDRYLWKIEFADEYLGDGSIFHLYTDLDNNLETGRQDKESVRGTDVMYSFVDGRSDPRINNATARAPGAAPIRGVVAGNAIYVCDDVRLNQEAGQTNYRIRLLSHRADDTSDSDNTSEWLVVKVPGDTVKPKPPLPLPVRRNFEMLPASQELIYELWQDDKTVRLPIEQVTVTGFIVHTNRELEGKGDAGEKASFPAPKGGKYYFAFVIDERPGRLAGLELLVNGKSVGEAAGSGEAGRFLLFTSEPISLQPGDAISLVNAKHGGASRFGEWMLLTSKPTRPALRVRHVERYMLPNEPGERPDRIMIAWTTNRPAECSLHYQIAGPEAYFEEGTLEEGAGRVNNHAIVLPESLRASRYRFRIDAAEPAGAHYEAQTASSEPFEVAMRSRGLTELEPTRGSVSLYVAEETAAPRRAWPVASGVPFPQGALADGGRCRLVDGNGRDVPAQFEPLAYWPDGSVQWLLVAFTADTRAGGETKYVLQYNVPPRETHTPLRVEQTDAGVIVDTGAARFTIARNGFAPFRDVRVGDRLITSGDGGGFELTNADGKRFRTDLAAPEEVVVEAAGPVRATVKVTGRFAAEDGSTYMRYLCRLHFYAGRAWARVVFSVDNDVLKPRMNLIGDARLRLPTDLAGGRCIIGGDDGTATTAAIKAPIRLLQDYDDRYRVTSAAAPVQGKRAPGFVAATGSAGAVLVAVRDFWQLYPKGLVVSPEGIDIELLPELPEDQYSSAEDQELLTRLYFWCDRGKYKLASGVRITTELLVDFAPPAGAEAQEAAHFQHPLFAACTPDWYCKTGVFGSMVPRRRGAFDVYEEGLDKAFADFLERRESVREYGFMNYGDWFGERTWNWGNIEYDTQYGLAINFARTGDLRMLRRAEEAEWHNGDVDTVHYHAAENQVGSVHVHCLGHTGGYFPEGWKEMSSGFVRGSTGHGHTWAEGHFALGMLTGERRYLETGNLIANQIARYRTTRFDFNSERDCGWPLIACLGAYRFTGNPFYLNAARIMVERALQKQRPETGQWGHYIGECRRYGHFPPHWGTKPFMTGVLLHGLRTYDLIEPSEAVKETIRRNCDFLWDKCYIKKDQGFIYAQCAQYWDSGSTWTISLVGDGLAYGVRLDPERGHEGLLREAAAAHFHRSPVGSFGKSFTQGTCFMPALLYDLTQLGITKIPAPPTPPEQDKP